MAAAMCGPDRVADGRLFGAASRQFGLTHGLSACYL